MPEYVGVSIRGVKKPLGRVGVMSSQKNGYRDDQSLKQISGERGRKTKLPHGLFPIVTLLEQE